MVQFTSSITKFGQHAEKTGWTYIAIPEDLASALNKGVKKSFRVRGAIDAYAIESVALMPMGDGSFIMPLNAAMRKAIKKIEGAMVQVSLCLDTSVYVMDKHLLDAIHSSDIAQQQFEKLAPSHQKYYSKWVDAAKQKITKEKRIVTIVLSLERRLNFAEMLRSISTNK